MINLQVRPGILMRRKLVNIRFICRNTQESLVVQLLMLAVFVVIRKSNNRITLPPYTLPSPAPASDPRRRPPYGSADLLYKKFLLSVTNKMFPFLYPPVCVSLTDPFIKIEASPSTRLYRTTRTPQ